MRSPLAFRPSDSLKGLLPAIWWCLRVLRFSWITDYRDRSAWDANMQRGLSLL